MSVSSTSQTFGYLNTAQSLSTLMGTGDTAFSSVGPPLTLSGLASGIDTAQIVADLMQAAEQPQAELQELAMIYVNRGLDKELAMKVAEQLSAHDRLGAHMLDELRIDHASLAQPMQAAWISAASFASFALLPIAALLVAPAALGIPAIVAVSLASLAVLGAFGGYLGGAPPGRAALRVTLGGTLAMAVTAVIGRILGVSVG